MIIKKGFVIGIIILFVGLAFIPSFNAVSISRDIGESNPVDDNIECKILFVKRWIALSMFTNLLYLSWDLSNLFPLLAQKIEDLAYDYNKKAEEYWKTASDLECSWTIIT